MPEAKRIVVSLVDKIVRVGDTVQATAEILDEADAPLEEGFDVTWSTSGFSEIASVAADGVVTARGAGVAEITAQFGSKVGKAVLTITG